ncbi:MAG: hypothetical protein L6Q26_08745, partial [Anaerolineales bacterium]|nr:hypothetical protein [Anaerolineales bacterium]
MRTTSISPWKQAFQSGLLGGAIAVLLALVGMVAAFSGRYIVSGVFTMGQFLFLAPILFLAYMTLRRAPQMPPFRLLQTGMVSGAASGAVIAVFVLIGSVVNLRVMFINAS